MARGWESKSVEEQQSEFGKNSGEKKGPLSSEDEKRLLQRQSLKTESRACARATQTLTQRALHRDAEPGARATRAGTRFSHEI